MICVLFSQGDIYPIPIPKLDCDTKLRKSVDDLCAKYAHTDDKALDSLCGKIHFGMLRSIAGNKEEDYVFDRNSYDCPAKEVETCLSFKDSHLHGKP